MLSSGGRRLQARRRVDDVARRHSFAGFRTGAERDERLARRDSDAHLELALLGERLADRERSAYGTLGIVLVRDRRSEDRHDGVADELLDGSAEALELTRERARGRAAAGAARPRGPCARRAP